MKLIIALGNPGKKYEKTRHNFAQIIIHDWLKQNDFNKLKDNNELNAKTSEGKIDGQKVIVAFPLTFMNDSGEPALKLKNYFKIKPNDLIVIHDDLDITFGRIKVNENIGSAGHKGVQSIINILQTKDFLRIRLGLKSTEMENIPAENYVLQKFSKQEMSHFPIISKMTSEALDMCVKNKQEKAMNMFN